MLENYNEIIVDNYKERLCKTVDTRLERLYNFHDFLMLINNTIIFQNDISVDNVVTTIMIPLDTRNERVLSVEIKDNCTITLGSWSLEYQGAKCFNGVTSVSFGEYTASSRQRMVNTIREQIKDHRTILTAERSVEDTAETLRNLKSFIDYASDKLRVSSRDEVDVFNQTITYDNTSTDGTSLRVVFDGRKIGASYLLASDIVDDFYDFKEYNTVTRDEVIEFLNRYKPEAN